MKPTQRLNSQLHKRLPIDDDEEILAVYTHHWFAYVSLWTVGLFLSAMIMGIAVLFVKLEASTLSAAFNSQQTIIMLAAGVLSLLVLGATAVPVWLRSREQLVLTDEALLQMLQPSLFASKISQLSLQHVADASVRRDFFGTILGYGKITIETPGEQDNYEFTFVPQPEAVVKEIVSAHENFSAALESGRLPTTFRNNARPQAPVQLSAEEYEKFLDYQRSKTGRPAEVDQAPQDPTSPA